jgi:hypothetical protein
MPKYGASLADDSRVIIYYRNMFIVQATDQQMKCLICLQRRRDDQPDFQPAPAFHPEPDPDPGERDLRHVGLVQPPRHHPHPLWIHLRQRQEGGQQAAGEENASLLFLTVDYVRLG